MFKKKKNLAAIVYFCIRSFSFLQVLDKNPIELSRTAASSLSRIPSAPPTLFYNLPHPHLYSFVVNFFTFQLFISWLVYLETL